MGLTAARHDRSRDEGAILVLTLVLTVAMAVIAVALASYAATGLRTSSVTNDRIANKSAASAAVEYIADVLASSDVAKSDDPCAELSVVPAGFWPDGVGGTIDCAATTSTDRVVVSVTATAGQAVVDAQLEVRSEAVDPVTNRHPVAITSWTRSNHS